MKRGFVLSLIVFVPLFYLFLQNASAATKNACEVCGDNLAGITDSCATPYSSGNTCYSGISCQNGYLLDPYKYCMTTGFSNTPKPAPVDSSKLYCQTDSYPFVEGYVSQDTSDPRTDTQCQEKKCGNSGWSASNKPDGTPCTYNGQLSTCLNGLCQRLSCECSDFTPCNSCNPSGDYCDGSSGTGVLKVKDTKNCNLNCAKYAVKTGVGQGQGQHVNVAEICYDTPSGTDANGKTVYSNWMVDEYAGSGSQIKETSCDPFKCKQTTVACGGADVLEKDGLNANLPKTDPSNPITAQYAYYCDSRGTGGTGGGGSAGCSTCGSPAVCAGQCVPGEPPYKYD
ncbi:Uncharacterised protein [uncultured archaeon]|nr:Uncharacterised protein [uncultured archaeon]